MNNAIVPVNEEAVREGETFYMRDGIRISEAEAEYKSYMDHLYETLDEETAPINQVSTERTLMMHHPWHNVGIGENCPDIINAIIEIPAFSRVKTELDRPTGLLKVDRILHSSVIYPANYGFIPETISDNNDPLDILVLCQLSCPSLSLMRARPIGIMPMIKDGEADDKIIAVAVSDPEYNIYKDVSDLPPFKLLMITQFFNDYRTLEKKEVRTFKPLGCEHAKKIIIQCKNNYHQIYDD
ncbi:soluble inorganic pyrophosphatase [Tritrichomonas foetus]|uniref:inorganic diphosphatase n=1 Tax=Tritrichomonas foetus TaxID=1144522 RepID=A0A1J4JY51_9EUKA|nr:soluble inorganic pyrophosphatase [Tritrichomonas foetus]|eukprot:OHT02460.1 soluble inorganic pyrophosphatase [Tritrichomonas foetus]